MTTATSTDNPVGTLSGFGWCGTGRSPLSGHRAGGSDGAEMEIHQWLVNSVTVVSLSGDLDARTAPIAREQLVNVLPTSTPVLLDLSEVSYVSSAGLRAMLMMYRLALQTDTPIALMGLSPQLRTVLSTTGFLRFFPVLDGVPDGIAVPRSG